MSTTVRKPRLRVILAIAVGTPLILLLVWTTLQWIEHAKRRVDLPPPPPRHAPRFVVEPTQVDLGRRSQCEGLVTAKGTLRNASDQPAILDDWIPSCGCTGPRGLRKGMTLQPGEAVDFEITSDSWAVSGEKNYSIDFVERHADAPVRFQIRYLVESPIYTDTNFGVYVADGSFPVLVRSRDQSPFRIVAADPPIFEALPEEQAAEHTLTLNWNRVDSVLGKGWRDTELRISTDRADCPTLHLRLQGDLGPDVAEISIEAIKPSGATAAPG